MVGVGVFIVCIIVSEVSKLIINNLWKDNVMVYFLLDEVCFKEKMLDIE